jgi:predicted nucleotidyltransferase component of viral defense system
MILQKEIITIAEEKGVLKSTIDKDWVLGHFLGAIYSEPKLREALIFKGGTCLKKCWFPDYRFSEDLDFTSKDSTFELKQNHLDFIGWHVKENAGIPSHVESLKPLMFQDKLYWL